MRRGSFGCALVCVALLAGCEASRSGPGTDAGTEDRATATDVVDAGAEDRATATDVVDAGTEDRAAPADVMDAMLEDHAALTDTGGQDSAADAMLHPHPDVPAADVPMTPADVPVTPVDAGPRAFRPLNDCAPDAAGIVDMTAMTTPVIVSGAFDGTRFLFTPECARLRVGQTLIFRVDPTMSTWGVHPLAAGSIVDGIEVPDPGSPIPFRDMGVEDIPVTFTTTGSFGFYCTRHFLMGHVGAVHVVE